MNTTLLSPKQLTIISGPCVVESRQMLFDIAGHVSEICQEFNVNYIFKASYRKANRTSLQSFTGIGDIEALQYLNEIQTQLSLPVLTDIHESNEVEIVAKHVDVLQIPAFLFRQTELLLAAGKSGKAVNIKKGQFAAPDDMKKAVDKVRSTGNSNIWVCERGTTFGYHDLVVDMRGLMIMRECNTPVIYDATHSVQKPSVGDISGGAPQFISALARAAVAVGVDGVFFETHPIPEKAKSDSATQLPLSKVRDFIAQLVEFDTISRKYR